MAHTPGPFTVEELGESAETERDLGVTRIVCAPAQYEPDETIAIAFVVFPDDAPLFAASADLLEALEALLLDCSDPNRFHLVSLPVITQVHAAIRRARAVT